MRDAVAAPSAVRRGFVTSAELVSEALDRIEDA
jgi:hypothetical protein